MKKMYKRILLCFLIGLLVLSLTGCNFNLLRYIEHRTEDQTQLDNEEVRPSDEVNDSVNIDEEDEEKSAQEDNELEDTEEPVEDEWVLDEEYFNETNIDDGLAIIINPENILSLVNKDYTLPSNYIPNNLVTPDVPFSFGNQDVPKRYIRAEAASALEELFAGAEKANIEIYAVSGYRSYVTQEAIYNAQVRKTGEADLANQLVALPGQSEHQTGLAMDISSKAVNTQLIEEFGDTKEGKWLAKHAHLYGFIIRYPKGKEDITGYQYEPWHVRYVGKEIAKTIFENDITLEEYFEKVKKI
ncbi:M15 family metallopeptidase [Litchfieldia alkalitelluris]|uniref:M15 family metallopeptidase n=1 Tax=Litchfieldia alkalitelluris TaxID=304268 RepID=UPI0038B2D725